MAPSVRERTRGIAVTIAILSISVAGIGCGGGSPFDADVSASVASLAAMAPFPDPQLPSETKLAIGHDITLFTLQYGEAQDCPSGCFFSTAYGLRNKDKIACFAID